MRQTGERYSLLFSCAIGSLYTCMDVSVRTGSTKAKRGSMLASEKFKSQSGEQIALLLQIEGSPTEAKTLFEECKEVVAHSLVETDGEASVRLDGVLKELNGLLKGLAFSQSVGDVHAILAILGKDGMLHVSHAGRAEAYVIRAGAASQITEYTRGKPTPAFVHIASGALEPRDVVVLSTQRLLRTVTPAQLAQLAQREEHLLDELQVELEAEGEQAALSIFNVGAARRTAAAAAAKPTRSAPTRRRRTKGLQVSGLMDNFSSITSRVSDMLPSSVGSKLPNFSLGQFVKDLSDPKRKRRAHLLLVAAVVAVFLVVWAVVNLSAASQRSQTRAELETRLEEITQLIRTADNRRLSGELDSANAILEQAEQRAKQVLDNDANLFRAEALDVLERIRVKSEEINNIVRLTPRLVVNIGTKNPDIEAQGLISQDDGEFIVFDRQNLYRVLLNTVEDPDVLLDDELILHGQPFPRYQTLAFQTTDNSIIELINGQPTVMKTDDPAGWIKGTAMRTYLRFMYMLSPENNQIYKYERLTNRYSAPSEYNVNGDLEGALDIAIDGNIYVLKEGGEVIKLLRGEVQPFIIRYLPEGALTDATKLYKVFDGNLYFLDPVHARIIVATDGGSSGEGSYVKQYILEGDQVGTLRDLYVDDEENQLYVLDEERLHVIDLR